VRAAGIVQVLTTALKLLPLLAIAGLALWLFVKRSPLVVDTGHAAFAPTIKGVTAAATLTLSALIGFESVAVMANKVRDPARNIPLATLIGTIATAGIYVITCTAVMLLIPADRLAASSGPFADVGRLFWGEGAARWMALFVMISALGCLNAGVLLQGEVPLQMARKGAFPALFMRESARGTPVAALCIGSLLVTVLVLLNYQDSLVAIYEFMVLLATTATLVLYLLCALAMLALLLRGRVAAGGGYRAWLAIAAVVGTLYALWAMVGAGTKAVLWGLVLLAVGVPVFFLMKRSARAAEAAP